MSGSYSGEFNTMITENHSGTLVLWVYFLLLHQNKSVAYKGISMLQHTPRPPSNIYVLNCAFNKVSIVVRSSIISADFLISLYFWMLPVYLGQWKAPHCDVLQLWNLFSWLFQRPQALWVRRCIYRRVCVRFWWRVKTVRVCCVSICVWGTRQRPMSSQASSS